jgi:rhodanese-related sulfurtransferase
VADDKGRSIDDILDAARRRLRRLDPAQADAAMRDGAILVDIRPLDQRMAEGNVPGALIVGRNVLEWRFDPRCEFRLPQVRDFDVRVIIMCSQGYSSSLAAASLQDLGLRNATDLDGGFIAWAAAGLPVMPGSEARN